MTSRAPSDPGDVAGSVGQVAEEEQVETEEEQADIPNVLEGGHPLHRLDVYVVCTEHRTVALVAEQANHAEELADRHHEDGRIHQPQRRRQHRKARVHGAEHPVQRPRDDHVKGNHDDQTDDSEPEQCRRKR